MLPFGIRILTTSYMAAEDDGISMLLNEPSESDERSVELLDEISAVLQESIKSDEKTAELKPEEVAWVDSCLEFGPEMSDDKWISLKNALLDALSSYPTSYEATSPAMESNEHEESVQASEVAAQDHVAEHQPSVETRKEAADVEVSVSQEEVESRESIFKVWDLETPAVEEEGDELIQQLKKLLTGSREGQEQPQPSNSSLALSQENADELVTSMMDLSLKPLDE
ncbi:hypothetical protein BHE74_00044607 [Ensete ventricosum]|nr:hypothetical protein BHE74_00044607 [Ensete ventricosum]